MQLLLWEEIAAARAKQHCSQKLEADGKEQVFLPPPPSSLPGAPPSGRDEYVYEYGARPGEIGFADSQAQHHRAEYERVGVG